MQKQFLINSKGIDISSYSLLETETCSTSSVIIKHINDTLKNNNILWIRNGSFDVNNINIKDKTHTTDTDLDLLAKNIYLINKPIILITQDGDRSVPSSYNLSTVNTILNSKFIIKWFTQNYDRTIIHQKLNFIPIGFNLHTKLWLINNSYKDKINFMFSNAKLSFKNNNKINNKILCDYNAYTHTPSTLIFKNDRFNLFQSLKNNNLIEFLTTNTSFQDITKKYNKYLFILCPRGNGLDSHRIWEVLLAGSIPIITSSPLDIMFIKHNLPVIILSDWNELNNNLTNKLSLWQKKFKSLTYPKNIYPKFNFNYWINL